MSEKAYYKKWNRDLILNRAKIIMKTIKKDQESKQEINTETHLKKKVTKREKMEKQISSYAWRKENRLKEYQKNYREAKNSQHNN